MIFLAVTQYPSLDFFFILVFSLIALNGFSLTAITVNISGEQKSSELLTKTVQHLCHTPITNTNLLYEWRVVSRHARIKKNLLLSIISVYTRGKTENEYSICIWHTIIYIQQQDRWMRK